MPVPKLSDKIKWQQEEIRKITLAHQQLKVENEGLRREISRSKMEQEQLRIIIANIGKMLSITYGEF